MKDLPFLNPACSLCSKGPVISMIYLSMTLLRTSMVTERSIIIVVIVCGVFVSDSSFSFFPKVFFLIPTFFVEYLSITRWLVSSISRPSEALHLSCSN